MKYILSVGIVLFFLSADNIVLAQSGSSSRPKKGDTVDMDTNLISHIDISCPVLSGGRGGTDGLLVINSSSDVQTLFGYNCNFPDVDFISKTLLYVSLPFIRELPYRVRTCKGQIIFSAYTCKNANIKDKDKKVISILIPKVDKDNGVFLDVNELNCQPNVQDSLK